MYNSGMLNRFAAGLDYLAIGHITRDLIPGGAAAGGTAAYAALTAQRLGLRAGILTAFYPEEDLGLLDSLPIAGTHAEYSTTFENTETAAGRRQRVLHQAPGIHPHMLPEVWRSVGIVHFGPVLDEIDLSLLRLFPGALIGVTPQGWLRRLDPDGSVHPTDWPEADYILEQVDAAVISEEDVNGEEDVIRYYAEICRLLAVTTGASGCRLFEHGFERRVPAERVEEIDSTGAGDIFAAAFFTQLYRNAEPLEAARFAVHLATASIGRPGLDGVPTEDEVYAAAASLHPFHAADR
jgi:sugar/nucleoside kinase (ribokinase family)